MVTANLHHRPRPSRPTRRILRSERRIGFWLHFDSRHPATSPTTSSSTAGAETARKNARALNAELLHRPASSNALKAVAAAGQHERVAVPCYEADEGGCHRQVVTEEAHRRLGRGTKHLGGQ
ncbi:DUF488 family protein [Actinoplanes sp. NPDC051859]|uniref:DUF488 family protein, N3 subclade n=1 Tax=Actinoplanes sp. NPDC051859 TaxID=3363909 RepID=UPI00379B898A